MNMYLDEIVMSRARTGLDILISYTLEDVIQYFIANYRFTIFHVYDTHAVWNK